MRHLDFEVVPIFPHKEMLDEYLGRHLKINEMNPILGALVFLSKH